MVGGLLSHAYVLGIAHVVELAPHQGAEDALATVIGPHADGRDRRSRHLAPGDGEADGESRCAAHRFIALGALGMPLASDLTAGQALLVGFAFSFSSTVFAVKALEERNEAASLQGRIAIGILVDDGIVIAENIYQHYERGKSPIKAAIDGTMEVIPPIVTAILTTILAFSIFFFLDGRIGEFFAEASVIVVLTLVVSLVEALIILPAHLANSKALQPKDKGPKKGFALVFAKLRVFNQGGDRIMMYMRDN